MTPIQIFAGLWQKDSALKVLIPAILCLIEIELWHTPVVGLLFFVLVFTSMDIVGFINLTARDTALSVPRVSYRILMVTLQAVLIALVVSLTNISAGVACLIAWWFTACDWLFYVLQNDWNDYSPYPWLSWSVFGILNRIGIPTTKTSFPIVAIIGLAAAVAVSIFVKL